MEFVLKTLYGLLAGIIFVVMWAAKAQHTITTHSEAIAKNRDEISVLVKDQREDEKKYIDVLGRIDERLKNIERHTR